MNKNPFAVARWLAAAAASAVVAAPGPLAGQADSLHRPAAESVIIDVTDLAVGERSRAPGLGTLLRRVVVVRVGEQAPIEGKIWFQADLYSPDGTVIARHSSPQLSAGPGTSSKGSYLFPKASAERFPELLQPVYIDKGGERILRESAFGFADRFTYRGENVELEGPAYGLRLRVFERRADGAVRAIADTRLMLTLND